MLASTTNVLFWLSGAHAIGGKLFKPAPAGWESVTTSFETGGAAHLEKLEGDCAKTSFWKLSDDQCGAYTNKALISKMYTAELSVLEWYSGWLPRASDGRCNGGPFLCSLLFAADRLNTMILDGASSNALLPEVLKSIIGQVMINSFYMFAGVAGSTIFEEMSP